MSDKEYIPKPLELADVDLSEDLMSLAETMARNVHEQWATTRIEQGWRYGAQRSDSRKEHPCLVPYDELEESERIYDRNSAISTLKLITKLGYDITKRR